MKALLYDMANIYQQKALESLDATDLAHAKRYREAADALEAQAKEIAELKVKLNMRCDDYMEDNKQLDKSAKYFMSRLESCSEDLAGYKALCDQMGAALEEMLESCECDINAGRIAAREALEGQP